MSQCQKCGAELPVTGGTCAHCGSPEEADRAARAVDATSTPTRAGSAYTSSSPSGGRFLPGTTLADRYRIVGLLGQGGMGEVYRADDLRLGQAVALKFLPRGTGTEWLDRLNQEVRTARSIAHPNVCRVFDVGEADGQNFLSMEYVDGEDLSSLLRRIGRLPQDKATQIARQVCAAIGAAHDLGILHRDLKPANIMLDGRGRVRVTDFGLAGTEAEIAQEDIVAGTPAYMAPEQLQGSDVSARSDIFALGLVLYELYTGKRAFDAGSLAALRDPQRDWSVTRPSSLVDTLDPAIEAVILRCLEPDPGNRPGSVAEIAAALPGGDPLAAALAAGETPSPELVAAAGNEEALDPRLAWGGALAVVALFAALAWWNGHRLVTAYLPFDRSPDVVADRARDVIAALGYAEAVYVDPFDYSAGYGIDGARLNVIREQDGGPERWEQIRDDGSIVRLAYRQRPRMLIPHPVGFTTLIGTRVVRTNPFPSVPGDVEVWMDAEGRLQSFYVIPPQVRDPDDGAEVDWGRVFELAGLDRSEFRSVPPTFFHFSAPTRRQEWAGELPWRPGAEVRIAAGATGGRVSFFRVLTEEMREIARRPPQERVGSWSDAVSAIAILVLATLATWLALANYRAGRADLRGASVVYWAAVLFTALWLGTYAENLLSVAGITRVFGILVHATANAVFMGVAYIAIEPYGRRISPAMLIAWNRVIRRHGRRGRDAVVGRAVLVGMAAGTCLALVSTLASRGLVLAGFLSGMPRAPSSGVLLDVPAVAPVFEAAFGALQSTIALSIIAVAARIFIRNGWIATVVAVIAMTAVAGPATAIGAGFLVLEFGAILALLTRSGLVSAGAASLVFYLSGRAAAADWTAWHARPTILIMVVVTALAAYSAWAATAGWSRPDPEDPDA